MALTLTATAMIPQRWDRDANDGAGKAISEQTEYTYVQCESIEDALEYFEGNEQRVVDKLNSVQKDSAKNNAYSAALNSVTPVSEDKIRDTLIKSMLKLGMSPEDARATAEANIARANG